MRIVSVTTTDLYNRSMVALVCFVYLLTNSKVRFRGIIIMYCLLLWQHSAIPRLQSSLNKDIPRGHVGLISSHKLNLKWRPQIVSLVLKQQLKLRCHSKDI